MTHSYSTDSWLNREFESGLNITRMRHLYFELFLDSILSLRSCLATALRWPSDRIQKDVKKLSILTNNLTTVRSATLKCCIFHSYLLGSITCLTFHNDTHMLSASEDRTICVWECRTWDCLKTLKGHRYHVLTGPVYNSKHLT